ncbi:MAG: 6-phosphogluconolactonase [Candidatus Methylomirabilales bacterium]
MDRPDIRILAEGEELSRVAAEEFVLLANEAVEASGRFSVALSGGSTPKGVYALLADKEAGFRARVAWDKVHVFWGDERHVLPDHLESNYHTAREALLSRVPIPPENIHRIPAENPDATKAAEEYAEALREFFRLSAGQFPRFGLILLGMGPDGHTASLFPGTTAVFEQTRLVVALWVEKFKTYRITLTPPVLNNAACTIFLVSGEEKAETLRAVLQGPYQPDRLPAQIVRPVNGQLLWMVDRAAAQLLRR